MKTTIKNEHKKYYNSKGEEVPSVTTILNLLNNNLDGWANYMGLQGVNSKLYAKQRAEYGTYVHSICEKFFKQELPSNIDEFEVDEEFMSYDDFQVLYQKLVLIKELFKRRGYTYHSCELSLTCDKYGGTIDLVLYNEENDDFIILDFKTSKNVYSKYFIQLAGYTSLFRIEKGYRLNAVCIILIDKPVDDKNFLTIRKVEKNEYNINIFNDLLNIYYSMTDSERRFYFDAK